MYKPKVFQISRLIRTAVIAMVLGVLLFPAVQADTGRDRGLLWEVSRSGVSASYLFGTIHSEDPEVLQLAAPVQKAFDTSQAVVLEVLLDMSAMMSSSAAMLMMDGRSLKDILGEPLFAKVVAAMQLRGMPEMMTEHMQPWAVAVTLSMPAPETGQVLDMVLYQDALQAGKQLHGLETIKEQLDVFAGMPLADQVTMLKEAVEHVEDIDALHAELLAAWKQRDLAGLVAISERALATGDQQFADVFQKRLVVQRNHKMAERMQPYLKEGRTFVAVGALHLPGEQGLLNLLEKQGYTIRPVY